MSFTRMGQWGAEVRSSTEWLIYGASPTQPTISSTKAKTGSYAAAFTTTTSSIGVSTGSATQIRAGVWLNHNGTGNALSTGYSVIFRWTSSASALNFVRWHHSTGNLELIVGNSSVASVLVTDVGFNVTNQWFHAGLTVKADASAGWASFYLDGIQVLTASGLASGASISAVYAGGNVSSSNGSWASSAYFDDFYCDSASSENDAAVPLKRFMWSIANGNGGSSQWTGSDGNSTDNYLLVDDATSDGDTTYVYAAAADLTDTYAMTDITLPAGHVLVAAIPTVLARRASTTEELRLVAYDGANTTTGTAQPPAASYGPLWERMSTQPDATDWNETDYNAMQFGIKSAGTY